MVSDPIDFESFLAFLQSASSLWKQLGPNGAFPRPPEGWADHLPWPPAPGQERGQPIAWVVLGVEYGPCYGLTPFSKRSIGHGGMYEKPPKPIEP